MEYVYAALLLHKLGKGINEENIKKIIEAAGGTADESRVKTLIASLKGVDIEKELETAAIAAPAAGGAGGAKEGENPAEKKEEKKEEAAEGLSSLFG